MPFPSDNRKQPPYKKIINNFIQDHSTNIKRIKENSAKQNASTPASSSEIKDFSNTNKARFPSPGNENKNAGNGTKSPGVAGSDTKVKFKINKDMTIAILVTRSKSSPSGNSPGCNCNSIISKYLATETGAVYSIKKQGWSIAPSSYNLFTQHLKANSIQFDKVPGGVIKSLCMSSFNKRRSPSRIFSVNNSEDKNKFKLDHPIYDKLMPFQYKGVIFGLEKGGRVLLADDMGLGKTIQGLAIAQYYSLEFPLLVIAPASLLDGWRESIKMFLGEESTIIRTKLDFGDKISVISYSLASKFSSIIDSSIAAGDISSLERPHRKNATGVIICDECHYIKNCKSKRSQSLIPILQKVSRLVMISGTPALSRPMELYGIITSINKNLFSSFKEYGMRYCGGVLIKNSFYDFKGCTNADELNTILENEMMIRRLKSEVLGQLPTKTRRQVILAHTPGEEGTSPPGTGNSACLGESKMVSEDIMAQYNRAAILKKKPVLEYLGPLLEKGLKFLVFAHHIEMIDCINGFLAEKGANFIKIIGSTPSAKRHRLVDRFQNDTDVKVALLSLTACSTGITLTSAKAVVFAELYWNPGTMVQAEDRIHRIGQASSVDIHYLVCKNTIDEVVWPNLIKKLKILEQLGIGKNELSTMERRVANEDEIQNNRKGGELEKFGFKKI